MQIITTKQGNKYLRTVAVVMVDWEATHRVQPPTKCHQCPAFQECAAHLLAHLCMAAPAPLKAVTFNLTKIG